MTETTPIFTRLVKAYRAGGSTAPGELANEIALSDWYHDRGYYSDGSTGDEDDYDTPTYCGKSNYTASNGVVVTSYVDQWDNFIYVTDGEYRATVTSQKLRNALAEYFSKGFK